MQHTPSENSQQNQTLVTPSGSMAELPLSPPTTNGVNNQPVFYTQEDDLDVHLPENEHQDAQEASFVLPFQSSTAMPTVTHLDTPDAQGQWEHHLLAETRSGTTCAS